MAADTASPRDASERVREVKAFVWCLASNKRQKKQWLYKWQQWSSSIGVSSDNGESRKWTYLAIIVCYLIIK